MIEAISTPHAATAPAADWLRRYRELRNDSMSAVSNACGVSVQTIHALEHGGRPKRNTLRALESYYGLGVRDLDWGRSTFLHKAAGHHRSIALRDIHLLVKRRMATIHPDAKTRKRAGEGEQELLAAIWKITRKWEGRR